MLWWRRRRLVLLIWDLHVASCRVYYPIIISTHCNSYGLRFISYRGVFRGFHSLPLWYLPTIWSLVFNNVFIVTIAPLLLAHSKLMLWLLLLEFKMLLILFIESLMKWRDHFSSTIDLRCTTILNYVLYVYSLLCESSTLWDVIRNINVWILVSPFQCLYLLDARHFNHFFNDKVFLFKGVGTVEQLLIINHLYLLWRPKYHHWVLYNDYNLLFKNVVIKI